MHSSSVPSAWYHRGAMGDVYDWAGPMLRMLPPERAHRMGLWALRRGLVPRPNLPKTPELEVSVAGLTFPNPVGIAAGFDKNAEAVEGTLKQGPGFVEIGTVTPKPQPGNPTPRLWRLPAEKAVINRLGFNNEGLSAAAHRLSHLNRSDEGIVGANIGKNKTSEDAVADYRAGTRALAPLVDYLTINVSSPNTPGLRDLQHGDELAAIVGGVREELLRLDLNRPTFLKIAPDLDDDQIPGIVETCFRFEMTGIVCTNTTLKRGKGMPDHQGGLSGRPVMQLATRTLARVAQASQDKLVLVGVGGVTCAQDFQTKIEAGAHLVQLYTGLVYGGFNLVRDGLAHLSRWTREEGKPLSALVGKRTEEISNWPQSI